jgi:transposase
MSKRNQVSYTDEFREQIAKLVIAGKPVAHIVKEYGIAKTTVNTWTEKYKATGSFRDSDNRSLEYTELIKLRKENKQLRMEVDLLKQAALIMARR